RKRPPTSTARSSASTAGWADRTRPAGSPCSVAGGAILAASGPADRGDTDETASGNGAVHGAGGERVCQHVQGDARSRASGDLARAGAGLLLPATGPVRRDRAP